MKIERLDLSRPVMAQLEITDACNHRCLHCYHLDSDISNRPQNTLSEAILMNIAQKIVEAEIFNVVITGGEPLLQKIITRNIIQYLKKHNIQVSINTNLTTIDKDMIGFLKQYNVPILTSCPSGVGEKYDYMVGRESFNIFYTNLKEVINAGARCSVNMVVTKDNIAEIKETATILKDIGCNSFSATPMFLNMDYPRMDLLLSREDVKNVIRDLLWVQDNIGMTVDILESLPKCVFPENILSRDYIFLNRKCQAGRTVVGISPNGDVRPCSTNSIAYGNIVKDDIRTIWNNMKAWRSKEYFPNTCLSCSWIDRCNAGCRINAKVKYGEWNSPDIWFDEHVPSIEPVSDYIEPIHHSDEMLYVNKQYKVRKEYDNIYTIYVLKDESFLMVNEFLMNFIRDLSNFDSISLHDLTIHYNTSIENKEFIDVINLLINKNIINYEKII